MGKIGIKTRYKPRIGTMAPPILTNRGSRGVSIPTAPSGASAVQTEKDTIVFSWTDNSSNETGFEVQREADGGGFSTLDTVAAGTQSYSDTTISVGVAYTYRVRAVGTAGNSSYSTASPVTPKYVYGYPAFGSASKSGTASLQYLFDEASGNIVDEVISLSLTPTGSPGAFTYEQTATGNYSGLSPGILCPATVRHFFNGADTASLNLSGTDDFVIEAWVSKGTAASGVYFLVTLNATSDTGYGIALLWINSTTFRIDIKSDDATRVFHDYTISSLDGAGITKFRFTFDRDGNAVFYINGSSQGSVDISSLSGKAITNTGVRMVGSTDGSNNGMDGNIYEFRFCKGTLTANSGGPSGG